MSQMAARSWRNQGPEIGTPAASILPPPPRPPPFARYQRRRKKKLEGVENIWHTGEIKEYRFYVDGIVAVNDLGADKDGHQQFLYGTTLKYSSFVAGRAKYLRQELSHKSASSALIQKHTVSRGYVYTLRSFGKLTYL